MPFSTLKGALSGLRVLDLSRVLAGPFCTQILGDLGAEVIKVEPPGDGDETRTWGPPFEESFSAYFLACNRNKKSLILDLKNAHGRALLLKLAACSDVLIENARADSRAELGLDSANLHAVNPKLIILSISGYGADDPQQRPGYDYVIQGMSGMMAMNGPVHGEPHKFGVAIADIITGLYSSNAILAGLQARSKSGEGYVIEVSLLECAVAAQANVVQAYLSTGKQPKRQGHAHIQIVPYQMFETRDGFLILTVGNDRQWQKFCAAAKASSLAVDSRFLTNAGRVQNREVLVPLIASLMLTKTSEEWGQLLTAAQVPHGPVWNFEQLFASADAKRLGLKVVARTRSGKSINLVRSPLLRTQEDLLAPPELGQHSHEILRDVLGMSDAEIRNATSQGACGRLGLC